jgi:hypothetical protein
MLYVSKITPIFNPYFKKRTAVGEFSVCYGKMRLCVVSCRKAIGRILP